MDNKQILEHLDDIWTFGHEPTDEEREAARDAIDAVQKQIPKKPTFEINLGDYTSRFICVCGKRIIVKHDSGVMDNNDAPNYCSNCGQKLDWSFDDE